jgi:restriction system protein
VAIPDFQSLTLPVLQRAAEARVRTADLVPYLAAAFDLTSDERNALLPNGRQTTIANRTHWALAYLHKAGLLARVGRGEYEATEPGRELLKAPPAKLTLSYLLQHYPSVRAFRGSPGNAGAAEDDSAV